MKVKDLRELLEEKLEQLENLDDEAEIKMVTNTYFLHGAYHFLGIAGYNGGYIDLDNLEEEVIEEDYEDEE